MYSIEKEKRGEKNVTTSKKEKPFERKLKLIEKQQNCHDINSTRKIINPPLQRAMYLFITSNSSERTAMDLNF